MLVTVRMYHALMVRGISFRYHRKNSSLPAAAKAYSSSQYKNIKIQTMQHPQLPIVKNHQVLMILYLFAAIFQNSDACLSYISDPRVPIKSLFRPRVWYATDPSLLTYRERNLSQNKELCCLSPINGRPTRNFLQSFNGKNTRGKHLNPVSSRLSPSHRLLRPRFTQF